MAYEGHDWQNDEVITADLLNAMEDGIEKGNSDGITSVTVNTLNAGESATASVSGGVLTLGIPKGDKGDPGAQGLVGPAGPKGDKGDPGAAGTPGAQGATGLKGADGVTPTIGANENWFIGSEDTGKPSRGAPGVAGAPGAAGPQGPAGQAGAAGLGVKTITLTTDSTGKVTSGKWTDTADGQHDIIVSTAGA